MFKVVQGAKAPNENTAGSSLLDEIVRNGARQMLATALQAEVIAYIEAFAAAYGAKFENGVLVQRPDESTNADTHAA